MIKFFTWTAVIAGIIAIPILIKRQVEHSERRNANIRYDIEDYVSEAGL